MERAAVVGSVKARFQKLLKDEGLIIDDVKPGVVFAVGGDGSFLTAEALYPGVPKVFIKHSWKCKKCRHNFKPIIKKFKQGRYKIIELFKLDVQVNGNKQKRLTALNDINIHYAMPTALRFDVSVGKKKAASNVIGDGVVIATPYGSTGYYHSITHKDFKRGIGIAFNNVKEPIKPLIVKEDSVIKVEIKRGPGRVAADCQKKILDVKEEDVLTIKKSIGKAFIIKLNGYNLKVINI